MEKEGKIWGKTYPIFNKNNVEIHRAVIKGGFQCSKHLHRAKSNLFFVESGEIRILRWKTDYYLCDETVLGPGDICVVPPMELHRFEGIAEESVVYEIYWVELDSKDITREGCGGKIGETPEDESF